MRTPPLGKHHESGQIGILRQPDPSPRESGHHWQIGNLARHFSPITTDLYGIDRTYQTRGHKCDHDPDNGKHHQQLEQGEPRPRRGTPL